ncbi:MAG: diguanylate cyclase [Anaerolineaceae bacterium]|nr:diguanylate cyclase [Anaerolineaceae bacterium]
MTKENATTKNNTITYTILSAILMLILIFAVSYFNVPNPNMILISAMVLFTGLGGIIPGAVSAFLMLLYSMYFFSTNHSFFQYNEINTQKIAVIIIGMVINFVVVAVLKRYRDTAHKKLTETNKYLVMSNEYLAEKAETAERIAELTESVTSLLTNMPALTFSKDIKTGKYLACNQSFAEYAHKKTTDEVVGLTDREIFDLETALHFEEDDRKALLMEKPFVFIEDVLDGAGNMRHFQTTKQKFTDTTGRLCLLGMSMDVSDLVNIRRENKEVKAAYEEARSEIVTYGHIAQALSSGYSYLYYIDINTDEFTEFIPNSDNGELTVVRQSDDFFTRAKNDAQSLIYEKDREDFVTAFTKENILQTLNHANQFFLNYRLMVNNVPTYVRMRASRMNEDRDHIVIGVLNIDEQMKQQEAAERIKAERTTYTRISALSGDFIVIYTVNPETKHYIEYSGSNAFDSLGISKEGDDFFEQSLQNAQSSIHPADLPKFNSMFSEENIMDSIRKNGIFTINYRLVLNGEPIYVEMKAAMIEEKDGPQLIVGVNNVDAQVKRDMEYENNLTAAKIQANRDELTGVKNKHAYAELEESLNKLIADKEPVNFAVTVFDVNNLKAVNDTEGHQAGDQLLKDACRTICHIFAHSPVFRVGGDEFVVISRGNDYEEIEILLAKLNKINRDNASNGGIIIASGMSKFDHDENVAKVFERADAAMYENKKKLKEK